MQTAGEVNALRISKEPKTGKRAFTRVRPSSEIPICRDTTYIPVDIDVYAAKISYPTLLGYICFVLGALIPFVTSKIIPSLAAPFFTIALVGIGAALVARHPRLFKPGPLLTILHDTLEPKSFTEAEKGT